jgi:hypothetical protein
MGSAPRATAGLPGDPRTKSRFAVRVPCPTGNRRTDDRNAGAQGRCPGKKKKLFFIPTCRATDAYGACCDPRRASRAPERKKKNFLTTPRQLSSPPCGTTPVMLGPRSPGNSRGGKIWVRDCCLTVLFYHCQVYGTRGNTNTVKTQFAVFKKIITEKEKKCTSPRCVAVRRRDMEKKKKIYKSPVRSGTAT